ncbi:Uncharacterised protein [Raoultella terrigena]|uniref:Uncharacterized protein n=1 Tax=Raoultella terrigena TaxID=577 RepID=A0A3P8JLZ4_RAOTE|nr:Uncharacterised protein [Raoultella terrigena]
MLKVIAEDFIKLECVATVLPLYRELVAATRLEPLCIAYDLYIDEKDPDISFLSRSGQTMRPSTPTVPASISDG